MADATLKPDPQRFPEGTAMRVYPASAWPQRLLPPSGAPQGSAIGPVTVTNGAATFTGLDDNTAYFAHANVGGEDRYVRLETRLTPADENSTIGTQTFTDSHTLADADAGRCVELNKASAVTLTVPKNADVGFPVGTVVEVCQLGAGQVTIAGDAGVTVRSSGGKLKLSAQYATAALRKRGADEWVASGDLTT